MHVETIGLLCMSAVVIEPSNLPHLILSSRDGESRSVTAADYRKRCRVDRERDGDMIDEARSR